MLMDEQIQDSPLSRATLSRAAPAGTVRRARPADAAAIAALHVRSWRAAYADIVDTASLQALDPAEMEQRFLAPGSGCLAAGDGRVAAFVATSGGTVAGWACAGPRRVPADMRGDVLADAAGAELYSLYLDPVFFGTGAGRALLRACMAHARAGGHAAMDVRVLRDNVRACRFYRRQGGRRLARGEDCLIGGRPYAAVRYVWDDLRDATPPRGGGGGAS